MALEGPSKTIIVEPNEQPVQPEPEPIPERTPEPVPEREKVPA